MRLSKLFRPGLYLLACTSLYCKTLSAQCGDLAGAPICQHHSDNTAGQVTNGRMHDTTSVDAVNRNIHLSRIDLLAANSPLRLERYYNSRNRNYDIGLGFGWQFNLHARVTRRSTDMLEIVNEKGRRVVFKSNEVGLFKALKHADGIARVSGSYIEWTNLAGKTLLFKGPLLTSITHKKGSDNINLYYRNYQLFSAADSRGNSIEFSHQKGSSSSNTQNRLLVATLNNLKNASSIQTKYTIKNGALSTVRESYARGTSRLVNRYRYGNQHDSALLSGVSNDSGEKTSTISYDSWFNPVFYQNHITGESRSYTYNLDQTASGNTSTTIVHSSGVQEKIVWKHHPESNLATVSSFSTLPCKTCNHVTQRFLYDTGFRPTGVAINTKNISWKWDDNNRPTEYVVNNSNTTEEVLTVVARSPEGNISKLDSSRHGHISVSLSDTSVSLTHKFNTVVIPENPAHLQTTGVADNDVRRGRIFEFSGNARLITRLDTQLSSSTQSLCNTPGDQTPPVNPTDPEETNEEQCAQFEQNNYSAQTTIPGATFLNATATNCTSYFDILLAIHRGSAIEQGIVSHAPYENAQSTMRWFPVVDFVVDRVAISQISRDLTSASYNNPNDPDALFDRIMREGRDMNDNFLIPLANLGSVSASDSTQTTTINAGDIDSLVFELVVQRGVASQQHIEQILRASTALQMRYGIELRVIEIP